MVVQDGHSYVKRMANILDNMIAAKRLPPMVVVFPDSGGSDAQGSERGLEYDTISDRYSNWVESELLPAVTKNYGVTFTTDPEGRAAVGGSSGGVAAFTMAWFHPERYHKVLSYSGTFVNQAWPPDPKTPRGGWEYHDHLIAQAAEETHPRLDGGGREGQSLRCAGRDLAQLAAGQQPHGGGVQEEGL